jgi:hypothetical protein
MFNTEPKNKKNKGAALLLTILVLSTLLAINLGISTILIGQIKVLSGMENSVQAFFAADTGIERALFQGGTGFRDSLRNGATYDVIISSTPKITITSKGSFRGTKRAIEVTR